MSSVRAAVKAKMSEMEKKAAAVAVVQPELASTAAVAMDLAAAAKSSCAECGAVAAFYCAQCSADFCSDHWQQAHALKLFQSHAQVDIAAKFALLEREKSRMCLHHPKLEREYYCKQCSVTCCSSCLVLDKHKGHPYVSVQKAVHEKRNQLAKRQVQVEQLTRQVIEQGVEMEQNEKSE